MTEDTLDPPEASVRRVALLLGTLVALTVVSSSAIAVALPTVREDLGLDGPGTAWVIAAYSLSFAITTAIFGRLADLHGLRRPMRIGIVLFTAGSLVGATAPSFPVLMAGRVLQGMGAGAVPVIGLGIIAARFTDAARGKALGAITAVVSIVSGAGPLIGGGVAQLAGWRWVLALPAIALLFAEPVARLAPREPMGSGRLDVRGAALVALAVTAFTMVLQSPSTGIGLRPALGLAAVAVAGFAFLAAHVRARPAGLLPVRVLRNPLVVLNGLAGLTALAAYLGAMLAVPQILARDQGWEPLHIGLVLLVPAAVGAVTSRTVGGVAARLGRSRVAAILIGGSAAGLVVVGLFHAVPVALLAGMALVFMGFGGGQVALLDSLTNGVEHDVRGIALGVFNLVFFVGGAVGSATVGGLSEVVSLPRALMVLALLPAVGALLAARLVRVEQGYRP
ncbi:MAG TPA: MFS transporter [Egibacteraceae bacterium]|nr:MFS transporter [Egibacteraceae bacterium]